MPVVLQALVPPRPSGTGALIEEGWRPLPSWWPGSRTTVTPVNGRAGVARAGADDGAAVGSAGRELATMGPDGVLNARATRPRATAQIAPTMRTMRTMAQL